MLLAKVLQKGLEVDQVVVEVIEKYAPPMSVKEVPNFIRTNVFHRILIKDYLKAARLMCKLLEK